MQQLHPLIAVALLLPIVLLGAWVLMPSVQAGDRGAADVLDAAAETRAQDDPAEQRVRSSASASASASASSSARSGSAGDRGGCSAEASSSADARSGDEHVHDEDSDSARSDDGACSAGASSRATAGQPRR